MPTDTLIRPADNVSPPILFPTGRTLDIGVDIDDVLYPWFHRAEEACERAEITNGNKATQWHMWEDYGCTKDQWISALRVATVFGGLYEGAPMPGVIDSLTRLREAGHRVHLVTARGFMENGDLVRRYTAEWLYDFDVPHDSLSFMRDKARVNVDVFADDGPHNVESLHNAGTPVYLVESPHNAGYDFPHRVTDFNQFADLILAQ